MKKFIGMFLVLIMALASAFATPTVQDSATLNLTLKIQGESRTKVLASDVSTVAAFNSGPAVTTKEFTAKTISGIYLALKTNQRPVVTAKLTPLSCTGKATKVNYSLTCNSVLVDTMDTDTEIIDLSSRAFIGMHVYSYAMQIDLLSDEITDTVGSLELADIGSYTGSVVFTVSAE